LGEWMSEYGSCNICVFSGIAAASGSLIASCGSTMCRNQQTAGIVPFVASAGYYGTTTSATNPSIVYGIRGMWPKFGITCEYLMCNSGPIVCSMHPPIYGFEKESMCWGLSGGTCNYSPGIRPGCFTAGIGYLRIPGAGGWWGAGPCSSAQSCFTNDIGRAGMVCISYC
jgi:hypothetical protein